MFVAYKLGSPLPRSRGRASGASEGAGEGEGARKRVDASLDKVLDEVIVTASAISGMKNDRFLDFLDSGYILLQC